MTSTSQQWTSQQWRRRQEQYRAAQARIDQFELDAADRYGVSFGTPMRYGVSFGTGQSWLKPADRKRLQALRDRRDRIADQIFAFLYEYSPRHTAWGHGVPAHWICTELTFEDAMTTGALSVAPPLAYGQFAAGQRAFCSPIDSYTFRGLEA